MNYCCLAGYSLLYVGGWVLFIKCRMLSILSSVLLLPHMLLLWLVYVGLSIQVLSSNAPTRLHSTCHFCKYSLYSTIHKNNNKKDWCLAEPLLMRASILTGNYQNCFLTTLSSWFTPLSSTPCFSNLFIRMSHQKH